MSFMANIGGTVGGFVHWMTSPSIKQEFMSQLGCSKPGQVSDFFQSLRNRGETLNLDEKLRLLAELKVSTHSDEWVSEMAQGLRGEAASVFDPIIVGVSLFSQAQAIYNESKNDQLLRVLVNFAEKKGDIPKGADGSVFLGELNAQKLRHGVGVWKLATGEMFVGEFENGGLNGEAAWHSADDTVCYQGQFQNGKFHGHGTCTYRNADQQEIGKYIGNWENNLRHGEGEYSASSTLEKYVGNYVANFIVQGKWTSSDGQIVYNGQFKNDQFDGQGLMEYSSGVSYNGTFVGGVRQGSGAQIEADGTVYDGQFADGKLHGEFVVTKDGAQSTEYYEHGTKAE